MQISALEPDVGPINVVSTIKHAFGKGIAPVTLSLNVIVDITPGQCPADFTKDPH
jgi:hypothetical protein